MVLATVLSRASCGIDAPLITIEVHVTPGLPSLSIVGLPETAVKESKDRVRSAIINSGFKFLSKRITVNLAPAALPKREGGRFDLAIAVGILLAFEHVSIDEDIIRGHEFAGELGLNGELRTFSGALPFSIACRKANRALIVPEENADEATLPSNVKVFAARSLVQVIGHLSEYKPIAPYINQHKNISNNNNNSLDLNEVFGQKHAKRALEIAAAGRHSLLMQGPPGTGKTMLAQRITTILPPMNEDEALETAAIYSLLRKKIAPTNWRQRRFRAPHHSASSVALVGGGSPPKPGEISLAHNGILFLDELPEFSRAVLETLREPIESGSVTISRAAYQTRFPTNIQLIAAMNPCPCGHQGDNKKTCRCTPDQVQRYQNRISGPFLDRIDMHILVPALPKGFFAKQQEAKEESSDTIKQRVIETQQIQFRRASKLNAYFTNHDIKTYCKLTPQDQDFFVEACEKMGLSARALHRTLKVARTIADLNDSDDIGKKHILEALGYRKL